MRWLAGALLVLLVLSVSCSVSNEPFSSSNDSTSFIPVDGAVKETPDEKIVIPPVAVCSINQYDYVLFKQELPYAIGLRSFVVADKGGWYKITDATVYVQADGWYLNDLTFECKNSRSGLMEKYVQTINITPTAACEEFSVPLNMNVKNLSAIDECSVLLGQGRVRNGKRLVFVSGSVDLVQYVK